MDDAEGFSWGKIREDFKKVSNFDKLWEEHYDAAKLFTGKLKEEAENMTGITVEALEEAVEDTLKKMGKTWDDFGSEVSKELMDEFGEELKGVFKDLTGVSLDELNDLVENVQKGMQDVANKRQQIASKEKALDFLSTFFGVDIRGAMEYAKFALDEEAQSLMQDNAFRKLMKDAPQPEGNKLAELQNMRQRMLEVQGRLMKDTTITGEEQNQFASQLAEVNRQIDRLNINGLNFFEQMKIQLEDIQHPMEVLREGLVGIGNSLRNEIGSSIVQLIQGTTTLQDVAQNLIWSLIESLIQLGLQMLANWVLSQIVTSSAVASTTAAASTTTAAWTPAAVAVAIATLGAALAGGAAAMTMIASSALVGAGSTGIAALGGGAAAGAPGLSSGTDLIPSSGLYKLHQGEKVIPAYDAERQDKGRAEPVVIQNVIVTEQVAAAMAQSPKARSTVASMVRADSRVNGVSRR